MTANAANTHYIIVGDTRTPIGGTLQQKNTSGVYAAVDLTGLSVAFRMVDDNGNTVVDDQSATIEDASNGKVSYDFQAADVDTAGTFWGWFIVTESGETDTFPAKGRDFKIIISEAD